MVLLGRKALRRNPSFSCFRLVASQLALVEHFLRSGTCHHCLPPLPRQQRRVATAATTQVQTNDQHSSTQQPQEHSRSTVGCALC
jgi:hypothetical protein